MSNKGYRVCATCVMDTSDPEITFDDAGVCNHCHRYKQRERAELFYNEAGRRYLDQIVDTIKREGRSKAYDCIIGVSGGIDSTMVAYVVKKQLGLRPLAVHMDNGWDSELAVKNIENTLNALGIDLYTHVVDWEDFRSLHLAFLRSSIANSEIPTDHAILAILYRTAVRNGIRFVIGGGNIVTEGVMPSAWMYDAKDYKFIRAIHKRYGEGASLQTYPYFTIPHFAYWTFIRRIRFFSVLNYVPFSKKDAAATLEREVGWRNYGAKHFESIYTRFFQAYILPKKFGIDKRRAHFSSLICSGQMTRHDAAKALESDPYQSSQLIEDRQYVLKKLGLSDDAFAAIMAAPPRSHLEFPSNDLLLRRMGPVTALVKRIASSRPSTK